MPILRSHCIQPKTRMAERRMEMLKQMKSCKKSPAPHDAIIKLVDGSIFPSHKILLAAYSELLEKMFLYNHGDEKNFKITEKAVTKRVLQALIDLIYDGDI